MAEDRGQGRAAPLLAVFHPQKNESGLVSATLQGGLLPGPAGPLVLALVGTTLLEQRVDRHEIARLERTQRPLSGPLHREWNFTTARPSAICRGSGFQAWP